MSDLAQKLIDAGLIQFGWFGEVPFTLHLDMLASYPDVLTQVVDEAQTVFGTAQATRLLCTADAIPFGVAHSLRSGIPLVYSRGSTDAPVFDLVGAYDIDHPTLLLTNSLGDKATLTPLIAGARRVGLEVHTLIPILEARDQLQADRLTVLPLLRLADVVRDLTDQQQLRANHAQAVLDWINS
ncbi:MAG TPA: hypothetical protein VHD90_01870 [Phototrophicaceae bacterium]|nr:hypothetical protein [Phototrophicaceae bacterium]